MDILFEDKGSFVMFGIEHRGVVALVLVLTVGLPVLARRLQRDRHRLWIGRGLALFISSVVIGWTIMVLAVGQFDVKEDLPIHLCHFLALVLPVFAWRPSLRSHEVLYYWVLAGTLQAVITPRLYESFPHYDFLFYWVSHGGLLIYAVYVTVTQRLYPTRRGIWRAFVWANIAAACATVFNIILDANYMYLMAKPPTASLFDYFGPWPWYLLVTEGVAWILFGLCYLPFTLIARRK